MLVECVTLVTGTEVGCVPAHTPTLQSVRDQNGVLERR